MNCPAGRHFKHPVYGRATVMVGHSPIKWDLGDSLEHTCGFWLGFGLSLLIVCLFLVNSGFPDIGIKSAIFGALLFLFLIQTLASDGLLLCLCHRRISEQAIGFNSTDVCASFLIVWWRNTKKDAWWVTLMEKLGKKKISRINEHYSLPHAALTGIHSISGEL